MQCNGDNIIKLYPPEGFLERVDVAPHLILAVLAPDGPGGEHALVLLPGQRAPGHLLQEDHDPGDQLRPAAAGSCSVSSRFPQDKQYKH